jgi:hypothetical protein
MADSRRFFTGDGGGVAEGGFVRVDRGRSGWKDRLRSYKVVLDGAVVGKLRDGSEAVFPVDPGRHSLAIRIDWTGSDIEDFTVDEGQTVHFACGPTSVLAVHKAFQGSGYVGLVRIERS